MWCLAAAAAAATTYSDEAQATTTTATTKNNTVQVCEQHQKEINCISVFTIYLCAYMPPHTYATVNWDITISYLWALIRYTRHFK